MALRIKRGESLHHAIKRMMRGALDDACEGLARDAGRRESIEGVHDARTALKKARALVRLVAPDGGRRADGAYDELREVGRELSLVRDAQVLIETFESVRRSAGARHSRKVLEARQILESLLHERAAGLGPRERRALLGRLTRVRRGITALAPDRDRWSQLGAGLVKGYRRSRRRMRAAYVERTPEAFHAWRRAVKTQRYQIQVLEPLWPEEVGGERNELEKLGDLLGEEHDLAVLSDTLREERTCFGDDEACAHFLATLEKRQRELRAMARPLGRRLFTEPPAAWARRHHGYFRAFRHEEPGIAAEVIAGPHA